MATTTNMTLTGGLTLGTALTAANGGTGLTSLGTGVSTALGQNVTGSGGIVLASGPTIATSTINACTLNQTSSATTFQNNTPLSNQLAPNSAGTSEISGFDWFAGGSVYARIATTRAAAGSSVRIGTSNSYASGITNTAVTIDQNGAMQVSGSITPSQTGGIVGTTTNNDANAGSVGELISSVVLAGSAISLTTSTTADITSISLTAGDWDVWGNVFLLPAATTNVVNYICGSHTVSATLPDSSVQSRRNFGSAGLVLTATGDATPIPARRISLSSTTTYYLVVQATFSVDTCSAFGGIYARRRR